MTEISESQSIFRPEQIQSALSRYRVMAWITGVCLIALTYKLVVDTILKIQEVPWWIGPVHGLAYMGYLAVTADLAIKVRWPIAKTIGVLLAGTIPLLGIIVEQVQTREIKEQFNL